MGRRTFSREFKLKAVKLVRDRGVAVDLPRFCGEALGEVAAIFSNCAGLVKSSAEWRRMGL